MEELSKNKASKEAVYQEYFSMLKRKRSFKESKRELTPLPKKVSLYKRTLNFLGKPHKDIEELADIVAGPDKNFNKTYNLGSRQLHTDSQFDGGLATKPVEKKPQRVRTRKFDTGDTSITMTSIKEGPTRTLTRAGMKGKDEALVEQLESLGDLGAEVTTGEPEPEEGEEGKEGEEKGKDEGRKEGEKGEDLSRLAKGRKDGAGNLGGALAKKGIEGAGPKDLAESVAGKAGPAGGIAGKVAGKGTGAASDVGKQIAVKAGLMAMRAIIMAILSFIATITPYLIVGLLIFLVVILVGSFFMSIFSV